MIRIFKHSIIQNQLTEVELNNLVTDFRNYKELAKLPGTFGRDVLFDHPHTNSLVKAEEVALIHLGDPNSPWSVRTIQMDRTSDIFLTYCSGF